jgi:hypothetical protein
MARQAQAQWNYSRFSGVQFPNPSYGGFNLGSPVTSYYPTNNYTAGYYVMNSIVSPTDTGYFGATQNSYSYPIPRAAANSVLLGGLLSVSSANGGLLTSSASSLSRRYPYAPTTDFPAISSYPYGGYARFGTDSGLGSFGYPYASASTGTFLGAGTFSSRTGTYLGQRFAYP